MWKTLKTETLVNDYHVVVKKNKVKLPDGAIIDDFYTLTIPDASMVAAITENEEVILKSEYRYSIGEDVVECPAGMFEPNETDPLVVAKRELLEETGYTSDNWFYLGPTFESTSKLTNRMHLFLATDCVKVSDQHLDANEHLNVIKIPLSNAVQMIMDGKIKANSSAHLILKVERIMESKQ